MQMMNDKNLESHELISEGADLMNQTFNHLMDFSEEFQNHCKSQTGDIKDLSTFVISRKDDTVKYFNA